MLSFFSSSQLNPSRKTVEEVVEQLERQCIGTGNSGKCEKIYSKLKSECAGGDSERNCLRGVRLAKMQLCRRKGREPSWLCGRFVRNVNSQPHVVQVIDNGDGQNGYLQSENSFSGNIDIFNPAIQPQQAPPAPKPTTTVPPTPPPPPPPTNAPPAPQSPPQPQPPAPDQKESAPPSSNNTLLIGVAIFGIFIFAAVFAVVGYLFIMKQKEKAAEEERRRMEKVRQLEKRKKRKMRKKKSKRVIVQEKTGEETRAERQEAKKKDRAEEEEKWRKFEEANQKENTFLNP